MAPSLHTALCDLTNADAYTACMETRVINCGHCGRPVAATVVQRGDSVRGAHPKIAWLLCPSCENGSVMAAEGAVWPAALAGGSVANLPEDVAQAWREARTTHGVAAHTASEMMCRKILMHLAVDVAGSKAGGTFKQFIEDLEKAGHIGPALRPSVEKVKDRGNAANHDLPASTEQDSLVTLTITEHLLRGIYEIPGL